MARITVVDASGELIEPMRVALGERVLDACDEHGAPVLFSCRTASCGVCRVRVSRGSELLSPAGQDERQLLLDCSAGPDERLACQLVVAGAEGDIELRAIQARPRSDGGAG